MDQISRLFSSADFWAGMFTTFIVMVLASLVGPWLDRLRNQWCAWRNRRAEAHAAWHRTAVDGARRDDRLALRIALEEMRVRHRSQTFLQWCVLLFSFAAFFLFYYLEIDAALQIPPLLAIFLVGLVVMAISLFVGALGDETRAGFTSDVLDDALGSEMETGDRSESSPHETTEPVAESADWGDEDRTTNH